MAKTKKAPSYLLPHNPLGADIIGELKRLKGEGKSWQQWELELLTAQFPDNAIFKAALAQLNAKAAAATPPSTTTEQADKETKAPSATTAKASKKGTK